MSTERTVDFDESKYYQEHKDLSETELTNLHHNLVALVADESVQVGVTSAAIVTLMLVPYYGMRLSSAIKRRETVERIFRERGIALPNVRGDDVCKGLVDGAKSPVVRGIVGVGVTLGMRFFGK